MIRTGRFVPSVLMSLLFAAKISAGEVLHSISDQSEAAVRPAAPAVKQQRRISYRVICAPGDEALPDCDQPLDDAEVDEQPAAAGLPVPDFPPEAVAEDGEDAVKPATIAVNESKRSKKSAANKSAKSSKASKASKSAKPSSRKASATKKDSAKKTGGKKKSATKKPSSQR